MTHRFFVTDSKFTKYPRMRFLLTIDMFLRGFIIGQTPLIYTQEIHIQEISRTLAFLKKTGRRNFSEETEMRKLNPKALSYHDGLHCLGKQLKGTGMHCMQLSIWLKT